MPLHDSEEVIKPKNSTHSVEAADVTFEDSTRSVGVDESDNPVKPDEWNRSVGSDMSDDPQFHKVHCERSYTYDLRTTMDNLGLVILVDNVLKHATEMPGILEEKWSAVEKGWVNGVPHL